MVIDAAVVGAGPAGLAASAALTDRGVEHVVLERGPGRRDLAGPALGQLPAEHGRLDERDAGRAGTGRHATGQEVVRRLERLADGRPVREGVRVTRLAPTGDAWAVATDDGELRARTVVVATGDQNQARVRTSPAGFRGGSPSSTPRPTGPPASSPTGRCWWSRAPSRAARSPRTFRAGGRRVILATSTAGRVPFRHRDRESLEWLAEAGFMDQRPGDLPDPSVMGAAMPIIASGVA